MNMRRTLSGVGVAVLAAVVLTGCGGDGGGGDDSGKAGRSKQSGGDKTTASPGGATHEVTLEVAGKGRTQIMYKAESSGFDQQTLPWTKTETVELTEAEQQVGYLVSIVPGSVEGADGMLYPAPCVIKVDGKQVADNDGGKSSKGCTYTIN